jgi:cytochrome b561
MNKGIGIGARVGAARYTVAQIALHWTVVLLVIEQYATSGAILRVHAYRPLGRPADPFDLTLHGVDTRVGLLILALVAVRLLLRLVRGAPEWAPPLPPWRLRLASGVQYALYAVLLGQALSGALAIYLWWPSSALHKALFWALVVLLALHLSGPLFHSPPDLGKRSFASPVCGRRHEASWRRGRRGAGRCSNQEDSRVEDESFRSRRRRHRRGSLPRVGRRNGSDVDPYADRPGRRRAWLRPHDGRLSWTPGHDGLRRHGPGMMGEGGFGPAMCTMMASHADGRLVYLKAELKITEAQEPLWKDYAAAVRNNANGVLDHCKTMMGSAGKTGLSLPIEWLGTSSSCRRDSMVCGRPTRR